MIVYRWAAEPPKVWYKYKIGEPESWYRALGDKISSKVIEVITIYTSSSGGRTECFRFSFMRWWWWSFNRIQHFIEHIFRVFNQYPVCTVPYATFHNDEKWNSVHFGYHRLHLKNNKVSLSLLVYFGIRWIGNEITA